MTVLVDTGALFAAFDRRDGWHARMRDWLATASTSLVVPSTVVQETAYLVAERVGARAEATFLRTVRAEQWVPLKVEDLTRVQDLVERYADFPIGFVDASIVAIAERLDIRDLLTTDRRHFGVIRPAHCERLRLLP